MSPASEPSAGVARLHFDADLTLEVTGAGGTAVLRITDDADGLAVDVDRPSALFTALPVGQLRRSVPDWVPTGALAGIPVRLRSGRRYLGRVELTPRGRSRLRPAPAGLVLFARLAAGKRRTWAALAALGLAGATVPVGHRLSRYYAARPPRR